MSLSPSSLLLHSGKIYGSKSIIWNNLTFLHERKMIKLQAFVILCVATLIYVPQIDVMTRLWLLKFQPMTWQYFI